MILRRVIDHFRKQEWTAIAIDFLIVVMGVFIGMQVQALAVERDRQKSERAYLARLHGEVEQLIATRERYDRTRGKFSADLIAAVGLLDGEAADITLSPDQCDAIAGSAHTTVPPADLPTVTELLSTGRLDQLTAPTVRVAILTYMQEASRAHDLIMVITDSGRDLGKAYPHLITHHLGPSRSVGDQVWVNPDCRADAMRADPAFRNELSENAYMYNVYANRAVLPVSAKLAMLHKAIDDETGADHAQSVEKQP
ncbi:MAG: hypothetical protein A3E78_12775 [Alphaproteobacteria bacterium RIFCSPHIGHO2_12_FULL_63_12]|nr:MAG: hypothetical protein A3E78_12775 [Alphaproteobacteria bacterium RIFCSPHIGHO2_12_FULL_63_12]